MTSSRRALVAVVVLLAVLTAAVLWDVLGTVFFAITLVVVAEPAYRWLLGRGLGPRWASALATLAVSLAGLVLLVPFVVVLYQRRGDIIDQLEALPETIPVGVGGFEVVFVTGDLLSLAADLLRDVAFGLAAAAPVLGVKLTLLLIVVFALLINRRAVSRAITAAVAPEHHAPVERLGRRARAALEAIYLLQAATALATFLIALPLFVLLGYDYAFVLAFLAGLLQFLPIVGPSVVVGLLAAGELVAGDVVGALVIGVAGWVLVAVLPDVLVRPWLAERTAQIPGSLYFAGFIGGLLTLGPIGLIAGPVAVVLLAEAVTMLAEQQDPSSEVLFEDDP